MPITYLVGQTSDNGISTLHLDAQQKEILDLLMDEFTTPTGSGEELSPQQVKIIQKVVVLFSQKKLQ